MSIRCFPALYNIGTQKTVRLNIIDESNVGFHNEN